MLYTYTIYLYESFYLCYLVLKTYTYTTYILCYHNICFGKLYVNYMKVYSYPWPMDISKKSYNNII